MGTGKLIMLDIHSIELDKNNPRIKQFLEIYQGEITSKEIALALNDSGNDANASYSILKESIKVSKGIIHPIIVNHEPDGRYVAIEGNTRLQIYKDFFTASNSDIWKAIPSLVYENLSDAEIHSIRLQSHLVGPREWDPYSKAKYLYTLSEVENLPMTSIISMCGGNTAEINKLISAYKLMETSYRKYIEDNGLEFDPREFSKFGEYQRKTIKEALRIKGYTDDNFSEWVANGNIDTAQNVRRIPEIFNNNEAFKTFKESTIGQAVKVLAVSESVQKNNLDDYPYEILGEAFLKKVEEMPFAEVKRLRENEGYESKRMMLETISEVISSFFNED